MLRKMNERNDEHILRFITAFTKGDDESLRSYYLMFEWANGGSLEDVWKETPRPMLNGSLVKDSIEQLLGLAGALETTHNVAKIRHGDLKPENILRFRHTSDSIFGTLKIGDWGLAKYHANSTVWRAEKGEKTTTRYSTRLYEPPEVVLGDVKILGRQFDIWSMGCISLELIIWLLYGYDSVKRFRNDVQGQSVESVPCYEINNTDNLIQARLRTVVIKWIEHISGDEACEVDTAIGELMTLVKTRLLIVELPKERGQTRHIKDWEVPTRNTKSGLTPGLAFRAATELSKSDSDIKGVQRYRATSEELVTKLDPKENGILDDEERPEDYWFREPPGHHRNGPPEFGLKSPQDEAGHLLPGLPLPEQQQPKIPEAKDLSSRMKQLSIPNPNIVSKITTKLHLRSSWIWLMEN
jgi:serine/threonine protein kinase